MGSSNRGRLLVNEYPEIADQWHPSLNGVSLDGVTVGSHYKATWTNCPDDPRHVWVAQVKARVSQSQGCAVCKGKQIMKGINDLATTHPKLAAQWHPTLNAKSVHEVGYGSDFSATWTGCREDSRHQWKAAVSNRSINGAGCTVCIGHTIMIGINDFASVEPEIAKEWHPHKNVKTPFQYSHVSGVKVYWLCAQGHEWKAPISSRTNKRFRTGCPTCSNRVIVPGYNDLQSQSPSLAMEWDHERNRLLPSEVSISSGYQAHWLCSAGHRWKAAVRTRKRGHGCFSCTPSISSKPQDMLHDVLGASSANLTVEGSDAVEVAWRKHKRMKVDTLAISKTFGIPVVVEYDGWYFHRSIKRMSIDADKTIALLNAGFIVIRVREEYRGTRLGTLPITHPRFLQMDSEPIVDPDRAMSVVAVIDQWIRDIDSTVVVPVLEPEIAPVGAVIPMIQEGALSGSRASITGLMDGRLANLRRVDVLKVAERSGLFVSEKVVRATDFLVCGRRGEGTNKYKRANELGIKIVSPDEFAMMLNLF